MAHLDITALSKSYGTHAALRDVTIEACHGELLVLLGPSGCGKTTLLRTIAGLETPEGGTVLLDGQDVTELPPHRRNVAFVFQSYALYPNLSVFDNIAFPLRATRMPSAEVTRRVKETAAQLGLADLLRRRPRQLSGGERQRVALARAIVRDPALFLMDEPLSNLDAKLRTNTRREILRLQRRLEVTMLFVTHDQVEAMTMGTHVAVMNDGALCQVGTPQEIYEWPANTFVAGFIGSPPMNLFPAAELTVGETEELRHRGGRGWLVPSGKALSGDRGPYTLGIRPEDIHLAPLESATARGTVDLVEYLGSESVVTVSVDGDDWLIRIPAGVEAVVGEIVGLAVDPQSVHVFDRVGEHVGTLTAHAGSAAHAS